MIYVGTFDFVISMFQSFLLLQLKYTKSFLKESIFKPNAKGNAEGRQRAKNDTTPSRNSHKLHAKNQIKKKKKKSIFSKYIL